MLSNRMLNVNDLPLELLHEVFAWLSTVDVPGFDAATASIKLGWVVVSHVCKRWRDTILNMAVLWASIAGGVFTSQELCEELIRRARNSPLYLWDWTRVSPEEFTRVILRQTVSRLAIDHLERIAKLALDARDPATVHSILGRPLPQLRELYLEGREPGARDGQFLWLSGAERTLISPHLQTLEMRLVFFPFQAPALQALCIDHNWAGADITYELLMDALASCPLLEDLELLDVLPLDDGVPSRPVPLSHLSTLTYSGSPPDFTLLWDSLAIPPRAMSTYRSNS
ncbi:unnamed protein product [Peniophora sp. CBMAI 1063]|nr:unnamed protein product [Peniophora sp. CBMAI 1063]